MKQAHLTFIIWEIEADTERERSEEPGMSKIDEVIDVEMGLLVL